MRKQFIMSQEDLETLLESMRPVPAIMLQCGPLPSVQENANNAWKQLGKKMGFKAMTVQPVTGKDSRYFTAEAVKEKTV